MVDKGKSYIKMDDLGVITTITPMYGNPHVIPRQPRIVSSPATSKAVLFALRKPWRRHRPLRPTTSTARVKTSPWSQWKWRRWDWLMEPEGGDYHRVYVLILHITQVKRWYHPQTVWPSWFLNPTDSCEIFWRWCESLWPFSWDLPWRWHGDSRVL